MDAPRYSWTQPCCDVCWTLNNGERTPHRLNTVELEVCCFCGAETKSGIYVRVRPDSVPHPTNLK